jgi:hypothetical protein
MEDPVETAALGCPPELLHRVACDNCDGHFEKADHDQPPILYG